MLSLAAIAWSSLVWTALWADFSLANVLWGGVIGAAILQLLPVTSEPVGTRVSPVGVLAYLGHLAWSLVSSSAVVAWEVVTPKNRINQAIVAVPLRTRSDLVTTVVADTITLTPGTVTLEITRDPVVLYVHIMHLRTIEEVRSDVLRLEEVVLRAFPEAPAAATVPDIASLPTDQESS